jgi:hypothetical protein
MLRTPVGASLVVDDSRPLGALWARGVDGERRLDPSAGRGDVTAERDVPPVARRAMAPNVSMKEAWLSRPSLEVFGVPGPGGHLVAALPGECWLVKRLRKGAVVHG